MTSLLAMWWCSWKLWRNTVSFSVCSRISRCCWTFDF